MSVLSSYRTLFGLTGPTYVVVAFLARLPLAMSQMGVLLLVAGVSGSYGAGGASAGALAVTNAIASPLAGALTDRIGQRLVLVVQSLAGATGLVTVVVLAHLGIAWPVLAVVCAVTGVFLPQIGPLARVRWRELAKARGAERFRLITAAFSYEGAADEASFVIGPASVGAATAIASPHVALLLAAGLLGVFGMWFAIHPSVHSVVGHHGRGSGAQGRLVTRLLVGVAGVQLLMGVFFGSVQTGSTALATEAGIPGAAGLLHGVLGVGSVVAGLSLTLLPTRWHLADRLPVFAGALAVLAVPLLAVHSVGALTGVLLVLGLAVAPVVITTFSACEKVIDPHHLGAAMMVLAAATSLGYAIGSSTAGRLADAGSYPAAYAVTVGATILSVLVALAVRPGLHRGSREQPGVAASAG